MTAYEQREARRRRSKARELLARFASLPRYLSRRASEAADRITDGSYESGWLAGLALGIALAWLLSSIGGAL